MGENVREIFRKKARGGRCFTREGNIPYPYNTPKKKWKFWKMYGENFFFRKKVYGGRCFTREGDISYPYNTPKKKWKFWKMYGENFFFKKKCMGVSVLREKATFPIHITPWKKSQKVEKMYGSYHTQVRTHTFFVGGLGLGVVLFFFSKKGGAIPRSIFFKKLNGE